MSVIIFIISLAILILVHEFGHFIVAKKSGIRVDEFGLGFPPKLWSKQYGETVYTLNALPFGGFVKIYGEDPHTENIPPENMSRSMYYKPKWIQACVLVAGVTMNILFAWLLISLGFMIGLPSPAEYSHVGSVQNPQLTVVQVIPNSPASKGGLQTGDVILFASAGTESLQGDALTAESVSQLIATGETKLIEILYKRGTEPPARATIEPDTKTIPGRRAVGIAMDTIGLLKLPVHLALLQGAKTTIQLTESTARGLGAFLWNVVTLHSDFSQVSGPVGIAQTVSQAKNLGFVYLLSLVALISINLAVINLVPFPALDGGRLLFVFVEAIIRRPIPSSFVRWTNTIGFIFLLTLMVIITGHDIFKLL